MTNWLKFIKDRISKTGGTEIASSKSIIDAIGHDGTTDLDTGVMAGLNVVDGVVDSILVDTTAIEVDTTSIETKVDTVDTVVDAIKAKTDNLPTDPADESLLEAAITAAHVATDADIATVDGNVDAIKLKSDLLNSTSGTSTLNDANPTDTIVPPSLPWKMHLILDISTIIVAADDFTLEVKVGASGSERVVAYYKITSDGTDTTIDTGSGTGAVVKQRRIDISGIMIYTGEQVLLEYTNGGGDSRDVLYKYVCGV